MLAVHTKDGDVVTSVTSFGSNAPPESCSCLGTGLKVSFSDGTFWANTDQGLTINKIGMTAFASHIYCGNKV